jgi:hypothetical protein
LITQRESKKSQPLLSTKIETNYHNKSVNCAKKEEIEGETNSASLRRLSNPQKRRRIIKKKRKRQENCLQEKHENQSDNEIKAKALGVVKNLSVSFFAFWLPFHFTLGAYLLYCLSNVRKAVK